MNQQLCPIVYKESQVVARDFGVYIYHRKEMKRYKRKENLKMGMTHSFIFCHEPVRGPAA